ncbi:MAG: putative baseplate assembly protein [Rubrivivax sp.]|nr:putative baseplate assembly protein [Rubrivivax sp.]
MSTDPRQHCCDLRRLEVLRAAGSANAIEFIEVRDRAEPVLALRQRTLFVRLLRRDASLVDGGGNLLLTTANLRIEGGERIRHIAIEWIALADALPPGEPPSLVDGVDEPQRTLVVRTAVAGDHSRYELVLVAAAGSDAPPPGFDPRLARIAFGFKVECPTPYDCASPPPCAAPAVEAPDIDYLARDYEGLRRLMLDRLSLLAPGWSERSAADLGVTLVELLAYAADNLAYRQDAIATEAYLHTARRRISVRRHARLVDHHLHEGCNARAWVHFEVAGNDLALPAHTPLLTRSGELPRVLRPDSRELREALDGGALVFETVRDETLHADLNHFVFHTWGDEACCLPRGTVRATLRGAHARLVPGMALAFVERVSPTTGLEGDADRTHRHVVRLTQVTLSQDPSGQLFDDPPVGAPLAVTEIAWDAADALPFPLCLSARALPGEAVSVAWGNLVLADHGATVAGESLGEVPAPTLWRAPPAGSAAGCTPPPPQPVPVRFAPVLKQAPLTHGHGLADRLAAAPPAAGDDDAAEDWYPAARFTSLAAAEARPDITLHSVLGTDQRDWSARADVLASRADDTHFVVETDDQRLAHLRFGDDRHGLRPDAGTAFTARYRIGNGSAGNVGAMAIAHVVSTDTGAFVALANPLPAFGGTEAEDVDAARRDAPQAFRTQQRAVTAADYAAAAERRAEVQRAAASFRWTGSWHTVFVTADRAGGAAVDAPFVRRLRRHLERFRMAGYDLAVDAPRFVALDVALHVCVAPDHFRAPVLKALREVLSAGLRPDGEPGLFHPDRFSFGQTVHLSPIVAAAQAVPGVEAVQPRVFRRLFNPRPNSLADGVIPIGRLEVAQLANDPNFRERGRLVLELGGGK